MEHGSQGLSGELRAFPGADSSKEAKLQGVHRAVPSARPHPCILPPPGPEQLCWSPLAPGHRGSEPSTLGGGVAAGVAKAQKEALSL